MKIIWSFLVLSCFVGCLFGWQCASAQNTGPFQREVKRSAEDKKTPFDWAHEDPARWAEFLFEVDYEQEKAAPVCRGLMRVYLEATRSAILSTSVAEKYAGYQDSVSPLLRAVAEYARYHIGSKADKRPLLGMLQSNDSCIRWLALRGLSHYIVRRFNIEGASAGIADHPGLAQVALAIPRAVEVGATMDSIGAIRVWKDLALLRINEKDLGTNRDLLFQELGEGWRYIGTLSTTITVK